jgi:hypothetical protein
MSAMRVKHRNSGREYEGKFVVAKYPTKQWTTGDRIFIGRAINPKTGTPWQAIRYFRADTMTLID